MRALRFISSLILASCCFLLATVWFMSRVEPEFARSIASRKQVARTMASQEPKQEVPRGTKSEVTIKKVTSLPRPSYTSKKSRKEMPKEPPSYLASTQGFKSAKDRSVSPEFRNFKEYREKGEAKAKAQASSLKDKDPLKEAESALISLDKIFN